MEISEIIHFRNPDAFPARNKTVSLFNFAWSSTSLYLSTPSDDPVTAIRALRLRSTLSEIDQYYEKNIPDAESWLDVTETAITSMQEVIKTIRTQCVSSAACIFV